MIRNLVWLAVFGLTVLMLADQPAEVAAQADRRIRLGGAPASRVALVIGNSAYETAPLRNPVNDADDMAALLGRLGFAVTVRTNATKEQMEAAVEALHAQLRGGGVGVFYFAGHGVQLDGQNYLIPVGSELSSKSDVRYRTVPAGWVVEKIQESGNGLNVVILDACRNPPSFSRGWRSPAAGLASMEGSSGLLIAYSTAPGKVASDGVGRNSLYAKHLLAQMQVAGQPVEAMFRAVRTAVSQDPANTRQQTPWESSSLTGTAFYFAGGPLVVSDEEQEKLSLAQVAALYQEAKQLNTAAAYEAVIAAAPASPYAQLAREAIAQLRVPPAPVEVARAEREPLQPAMRDGREMVYVAGGAFWMGCNEAVDTECYDDEKPGRKVQVEGFWLDKNEVTVTAYQRCVEAGRCSARGVELPYWGAEEQPTDARACNWNKAGRANHPMNCVNWAQAEAYCEWAGKRLPREAEWEKGARGPDGRKYPWGNVGYGGGGRVANIADETAKAHGAGWPIAAGYADGYYGTAPVGTYPLGASPYGALDMVGNVWEWVADWYDSDHQYRSMRGGAWSTRPRYTRASFRGRSGPVDSHGVHVGFRCAQ